MPNRLHLVAVARGDAPADRLIRGARVVNVYSGEILEAGAANVALAGGRIAYVGPRQPAAHDVIDAGGLYLAPGWIEPHGHPWLLYNPVSLVEGILPGGTTLVFNDDLFFYLQAGPDGFTRMLDALRGLPVRYRWLVRLLSQSQYGGEAADFALDRLRPLLARPEVAGAAELTRWPDVMRGNPCVLESIAHVRALGKRADGHTAGASYEKLNAVAAAGISACHEAITAGEVMDRLRLGLWTILRHSSLRPDMPELARAITEMHAGTRRLMLTVDGPAPGFIASGGFIDEALRRVVAAGVPPVAAIQMATINPATYYHMDEEVGGIAPGRCADLVLLPDLEHFRPVRVIANGVDAFHNGRLSIELPALDWDALGMRPHFATAPPAWQPPARLPVIEFVSNVITRAGGFHSWQEGAMPDGLTLALLLDRDGRWAVFCWLRGFAAALEALAATYNTTTHLLVIGRDVPAMRRAATTVSRMRGGIATADGWQFALPVAGMMSPEPFAATVRAQADLDRRVRAAGFPFADILYSLLFLTCDFLPGWRLTPRGVLDVKSGEIIAAPCAC
ncbi:MAG TPA: adenine deaminase C-terminal domain-containing protein [Bryobacteraceae bacterium]|nr:adenine deaminase C-terminal domain-containing protein [Bryobacteraceae bacterium]